jgi:uncharacterized membrane protein
VIAANPKPCTTPRSIATKVPIGNRFGRVLVVKLAVALAGLFVLVTTAVTWAEHETYNSTSLDIAAYSHLLWNTAHGSPFETTLLLHNRLHLAEHVALLLLPLAPLYGLWPDTKPLLLLQQTALAASGLPIFWLACRQLGPWWALLTLGCYYGMPTLAEVALDAFYPIAFAALPVGAALALALSGWQRAAALLSLFALLLEEEAALVALGLAFYLLVFGSSARRIGASLFAAALVWLVLAETVAMPAFSQPNAGGAETRPEGHFRQLLANPSSWVGTVVATRLEPDLLRGLGPSARGGPPPCPQPGQCSALRWWLYPTAGLALLSPQVLSIAAPPAAALLLADRPGRFRRHWSAPILPVVWTAAVFGLAKLGRRRALGLAGGVLLLAASLVMYRLDSPLPLGTQFEASDVVPSASSADLRRLAACIPEGASVAASRRGLAHLANRHEIHVFPLRDYSPALWPANRLPAYLLLDLRNADTVRELESPSSPLRTSPPYQEARRTPNALLLSHPSVGSSPSLAC